MKVAAPPLLPLLRSRVQGDLLSLLYLHPETSYSLTDIARHAGVSLSAVHTEVNRLAETGYLRDERVGNVRRVRAATDTPTFRPLAELLEVTFGPRPVLADALSDVAGIEQAYIYGSWAARYEGRVGGAPNDVDVLVVGSADLDELDEVARAAQVKLGRPVNITRLAPHVWNSTDTQPFVATLRAGALVPLVDHTPSNRTPSNRTQRHGEGVRA